MKKAKKKKKIPMRTQMKRAAKAAHNALSQYVRAIFTAEYNGKCPLCGVNPIQALFHILRSKTVKILRYDLRNVIASCHKCNWIEYRNPDPSRAWYIRRYGVDQYLQLVDEGANKLDFTLEDYQNIKTRMDILMNEFTLQQNLAKLKSAPSPDSMKGAGDEFGGSDYPHEEAK